MIDFTYLYDKHIDNLFAFGSRFSSDREMIKDCIQDVFVKLYTKKDNLDNVENIDSYLYVSLRNRINDEYRRNIRLCDKEINDTDMKKVAEADAFAQEKHERQQVLNSLLHCRQRYFFFCSIQCRCCHILSLSRIKALRLARCQVFCRS